MLSVYVGEIYMLMYQLQTHNVAFTHMLMFFKKALKRIPQLPLVDGIKAPSIVISDIGTHSISNNLSHVQLQSPRPPSNQYNGQRGRITKPFLSILTRHQFLQNISPSISIGKEPKPCFHFFLSSPSIFFFNNFSQVFSFPCSSLCHSFLVLCLQAIAATEPSELPIEAVLFWVFQMLENVIILPSRYLILVKFKGNIACIISRKDNTRILKKKKKKNQSWWTMLTH